MRSPSHHTLPETRFEGHDVILTDCSRVLRRAREFASWPAKTSPAFRQKLERAAGEARQRAEQSRAFLERCARTAPDLATKARALVDDYDLAARPAVNGNAARPLTSLLARSSTSQRVVETAELLERLERVDIDAMNLDLARARSRAEVDWQSPDDEAWHLALATAELEFALASLPLAFSPSTVHVPLKRRARRTEQRWRPLLRAAFASFIVSALVLVALATFASANTSRVDCGGGSELEGVSSVFCLLLAFGGAVGAIVACSVMSFFVSFAVFSLAALTSTRASPREHERDRTRP